jgi:hypothetical protein
MPQRRDAPAHDAVRGGPQAERIGVLAGLAEAARAACPQHVCAARGCHSFLPGTHRLAELSAPHSIPTALRSAIDHWRQAGQPDQQSVRWPRESWLRAFPELSSLLASLPEQMNRTEAAAVAARTRDEHSAVGAFIAAMIWGYGPIGYGPFRARRVLDQNPDAPVRLLACAETARNEGPLAAFRCLADRPLRFLGPAFGTKYLCFCTRAVADRHDGRTAPVLDSAPGVARRADERAAERLLVRPGVRPVPRRPAELGDGAQPCDGRRGGRDLPGSDRTAGQRDLGGAVGDRGRGGSRGLRRGRLPSRPSRNPAPAPVLTPTSSSCPAASPTSPPTLGCSRPTRPSKSGRGGARAFPTSMGGSRRWAPPQTISAGRSLARWCCLTGRRRARSRCWWPSRTKVSRKQSRSLSH